MHKKNESCHMRILSETINHKPTFKPVICSCTPTSYTTTIRTSYKNMLTVLLYGQFDVNTYL